jgi:RNA-dependent RNA polymerase
MNISPLTVPPHCMSIPRVLLTPTRLALVGFETEMSNRVVRKFVREHGFRSTSFMRLQVAEEDGQSLYIREESKKLIERLKTTISRGITINGSLYLFLAYSSSQLKECSMWFVCPRPGWSVPKIRQSLGDFSMCTTPSKYAARIGQCFSTTFAGSLLSNNRTLRYTIIDDIPSSHRDTLHSDGTGIIRRDLLVEIVRSAPNPPPDPFIISGIQIRDGGAKGVLTAYDSETPEIAALMSSYDVCLRRSMIKFKAEYEQIEICSLGKTAPYYLNRNVILLLVDMGVPQNVFISLQSKMIQDLDDMLVDGKKALYVLPRLSVTEAELRDVLCLMLQSEIEPSKEPFLISCLNAIRLHQLHWLSKKSRIFVELGGVYMGGLDETGLLPNGCIFFQVLDSDRRGNLNGSTREAYKPYVGPVLVTKHPVMHPGDIRMLMAVDIPALRNHFNILLFSQHGSRPEPSKMSGSDLDGDEFAITWDSRLFLGEWNGAERQGDGTFVSSRGSVLRNTDAAADYALLQKVNHKPLEYESAHGQPFQASSSAQDDPHSQQLIEYFFHFALKDILGPVAMLWQDHASVSGATSAECQELAEIYSEAVDFAKSGVAASIPSSLCWKKRYYRAHWREKKDSLVFHCKGVIGILYDAVKVAMKSSILQKTRVAVANRKIDKHGQILCIFDTSASDNEDGIDEEDNGDNNIIEFYENEEDEVVLSQAALTATYDFRLGLSRESMSVEHFGILQEIATKERTEFEIQLVSLMNQHGIRSEGELFTGCIRKYHKANKKKQNEIAIKVRSDCRDICSVRRDLFFLHVFRIASAVRVSVAGRVDGSSMLYQMQDETTSTSKIVKWVEPIATGKTKALSSEEQLIYKTAGQLAGAYYDASYSTELRWKEEDQSQVYFGFPWLVADVLLRPHMSI